MERLGEPGVEIPNAFEPCARPSRPGTQAGPLPGPLSRCEPVRLSRCLGESADTQLVLLLRETATGLQCAARFRRYRRQCSGQGSFLRRFTDGDHVIATGNHVRILHLHIGGQKAFAGGIQSVRLFEILKPLREDSGFRRDRILIRAVFERYGKWSPVKLLAAPGTAMRPLRNPCSDDGPAPSFAVSVPDRNGDACLIYVLNDINLAIRAGCFARRSRRTKSHASGVLLGSCVYSAVLKRLLCRISISMGLPERIKKILVPDPSS